MTEYPPPPPGNFPPPPPGNFPPPPPGGYQPVGGYPGAGGPPGHQLHQPAARGGRDQLAAVEGVHSESEGVEPSRRVVVLKD